MSANHSVYLSFLGDEEFDELCFEFGLELDEIVSRMVMNTIVCIHVALLRFDS